MLDTVLLAVLMVALALGAHYFKRWKMIQTLERFPGPRAYPVIGNTIGLLSFKFNLHAAIEHWTKQHGDIFRIYLGSVPFVILSKPADLEILLSSPKHIEKADIYNHLRPWIGDGLLTSKGKKWHTRRKLITPTFHFRILDQFVEVFNKCSELLVRRLLDTKEAINVHSLITLCTLDIICETAMGTKVDAQNDSTSPYVMAVHNALSSFHNRMIKPWLHLDAAFNASADGKVFNGALQVLHKYTGEVIGNRKREREALSKDASKVEDDIGVKKREAFLDQLLEANDTHGANLSDRDISEEVDTFMFEGHDTTAAALSYIMYCLAANPDVQQKVLDELEDIFGDSDRPASSQDLQKMKYTERAIKESLRLYPVVPMFARKMREDLPITDGHIIPAGANVTISCFMMGRDSKQWPEPEKFDPDRHLPENTTGRHPYAYIPFSAGPRNCIGQKFAMVELKATTSMVVRQCKLSLPSPGYTPRVEGQVILRAPEGVMLKIAPRKATSTL